MPTRIPSSFRFYHKDWIKLYSIDCLIPLALEEMPSSILKQNNFMDVALSRRWILVAGTGKKLAHLRWIFSQQKPLGRNSRPTVMV